MEWDSSGETIVVCLCAVLNPETPKMQSAVLAYNILAVINREDGGENDELVAALGC